MMMQQHFLFFRASFVLVMVTTSAQHSPAISPTIPKLPQSPLASPPGMNMIAILIEITAQQASYHYLRQL